MRVADRLARREAVWRELDLELTRLEGRRPGRTNRLPPSHEILWWDGPEGASPEARSTAKRVGPPRSGAEEVIRLGELYRAACADLMLAEAHHLPRATVDYLHRLVARAHNAIYRAQGFKWSDLARAAFATAPRQLRADPTLKLAALVFYGVFLVCALLGAGRPDFALTVVGEFYLKEVEHMYADQEFLKAHRDDAAMTGFYIRNNTSIGLQCFAWGLAFGLGTLYVLVSNAVILGAIFGHMATVEQATNFYTFVTAHAPFELTAIVFSGAAGLRLGWGLIETRGQTRLASLRREAVRALPTVGAAAVLFVLAAFLEGFVSASSLPYGVKAMIALVSAGMIGMYLALGGRERSVDRRPDAGPNP